MRENHLGEVFWCHLTNVATNSKTCAGASILVEPVNKVGIRFICNVHLCIVVGPVAVQVYLVHHDSRVGSDVDVTVALVRKLT